MQFQNGPDAADGDSGFSDASVVSPSSSEGPMEQKLKKSRTKPNCNKCKNHKVINPLYGHKRYCQYRTCGCELCILTEERRRVMAAQTRQKRAQVQDEKNGLPLELRAPVTLIPASPTAQEVGVVSTPSRLSPTTVITTSYDTESASCLPKKRKLEDENLSLNEAARQLIADFGVADSVFPLALALLKRLGDYKVVTSMVSECQEFILERTRLTASLVHDRQTLFVHGPNYVPEAHSNSQSYSSYKPLTDSCGAISLIHRARVV